MDSSPLAAMHRPSAVPGPFFPPNHHCARPNARAAASLRDQRPKHLPRNDFFHSPTNRNFNAYSNVGVSVNVSVRGSSPAASLCADLSENFRINNEASSPVMPTPRRALFHGGCDRRAPINTPSMLSSSPIPLDSPIRMNVNPSYSSPLQQDEDEMMIDSPVPVSGIPTFDLSSGKQAIAPSDRRRAAPRRPSISRGKGLFSTGSAVALGRTAIDSAVPPFGLAAGGSGEFRFTQHKNLSSSGLTLGECFEAGSPPPAKDRVSAHADGSPGQPGSGHRRPSNPFLRTRKQVRRSLSMFEHPADVMKSKAADPEETAAPLRDASMMDVTEDYSPVRGTYGMTPAGNPVMPAPSRPTLPHLFSDDPSDTIPRITLDTLVDVLDGKFSHHFDHKMVVDCRFEYEYDGGHIDGAVNYNDKEMLAGQLFRHSGPGRTLIVFHCEYSVHRAPLMARHVRSEDRAVNAEHYPRLTYPDIYILEGGYSSFYDRHRARCYPQDYVEMSDARHQRTCERELGRLKARKNFARAKTYAFGQKGSSAARSSAPPPSSSPCAEDTPITKPRLGPIDMIGNSPILGERNSAPRRMASY